MTKDVIAIFAGRFQPMGRHHYDAYKWLASKFGKENTYIATSNKVDLPKSPLNFSEKKQIANKYGIGDNIVQVKNPYQAQEITSRYSEDTPVVFMVGKKDMQEDPRFAMKPKKDGSPSYFQPYNSNKKLEGYKKHGYLIVAPHMSYDIAGIGEMSGTNIRKALSNPKSTPDQFKDIFGWYDPKIEKMIKNKFSSNTEDFANKLEERAINRLIITKLIKEDFDISRLIDPVIQIGGAGLSSAKAYLAYSFVGKVTASLLTLARNFRNRRNRTTRHDMLNDFAKKIDNDESFNKEIIDLISEFGGVSTFFSITKDNKKREANWKLVSKKIVTLPSFIKLFDETAAKYNLTSKIEKRRLIEDILDSLKQSFKLDGEKIIKRLKSEYPELTKDKNIDENVILEGGVAGHMAHPFDIPSVKNGSDLIKVFEETASYLQKKQTPVKIDGVNSSIRLAKVNGKRQFVIDRGSNKPLDVKGVSSKDLTNRFGEGHGMIKIGGKVLGIFNNALPKIQSELKELGMLENPNIMLNIEYVEGQSNVQKYDKNFLAIHNLLEIVKVSDTKRAAQEVSYDKKALQSLIQKVNSFAQKENFEVVGEILSNSKGKPNFSSELSKSYIVNLDGKKKEKKSLRDWLQQASNTKGQKLKLKDGKTVDALSKQVFIWIRDGKPINELVLDSKDYKLAIDSFVIYEATMKLGDEILKTLTSPIGDVQDQEGVVVRNPKVYDKPYKITGSFIIRGLNTQFGK